jgi:elongator complex protein 3
MPDMIKIYPCVVNEHADLYKLYKEGKHQPYTNKQLLNLLIKIKKITPPWVRITRLIRDIPEESIIAGNKITNLRQLLQDQAKKDGWSCQCIRCREAGHQLPRHSREGGNPDESEFRLQIRKYQANQGTEYFLSYESRDEKVLYAFLRLRLPNNTKESLIPELSGAALIRELHTYGQLAELGEAGEVQHLGLGKMLLAEAENISKQHGFEKIAVISGIGVRQYYKKLGYNLSGSYMTKKLA